MLIGARSDQGPHRTANEDAYWISGSKTPVDWGELYVVADGVGGQEHGAAAAQQAVREVSKLFYQKRQGGQNIPTALTQAILHANQAIYEQAQARGGIKMGCTLVAGVQHEGQLYIAHVGDARAYLFQGNRLRLLTRDDTWVQKQVDAGIITVEEAENHEMRNIVTQVLGNKLEIVVHQSAPHNLYEGDKLLLCSDGLHGVLNDKHLFLLLQDASPQDAADALVRAAITAETQDNVTAVVVNSASTAMKKGNMLGGRLPTWAIATLGTAVLLLIGLAVISFWPADNAAIDLGGGSAVETELTVTAPATAVPLPPSPTVPIPATTVPTAVVPTVTAVPPATITITSPPIDTPSPVPTLTAILPLFGCVTGASFVWQDDQVYSNSCDHFAREGSILPDGEQVRILDNNAISVNGPDHECILNQFIKIQSVTTPAIEGWVIQTNIRILPAGESCQNMP